MSGLQVHVEKEDSGFGLVYRVILCCMLYVQIWHRAAVNGSIKIENNTSKNDIFSK